MSNDDNIPVLTDAFERVLPEEPEAREQPAVVAEHDIDDLQARICESSLQFAEEMLRDACREAEHVMVERIMGALRAELPAIVRNVLDENLNK